MKKTRFIPLAGSVAPGAAELDPLLRPGQVYGHPRAVAEDPFLTLPEKRAILSSWASDACAVESMPTLRRPPNAAEPVSYEDIMEVLRELDHQQGLEEAWTTGAASHSQPLQKI